MQIDVLFGLGGLVASDVTNRVVAVVDVLRASTTVAVAMVNGARAIIPFESSEEVLSRLKAFDRAEVRLAGERRMHPISGFDLGNSPREFTREAVEGKTVLMATTNGTPTLTAVQGARDVVVASYVNFSACLAMLRAALRGGTDVTIVCAGHEKRFALEDAACAGRYSHHMAKRLAGVTLNDAAQACVLLDRRYGDNIGKVMDDAAHGRALRDAGYGDDIALCASLDAYPVVPVYQDRQITRLGPDRER